MESPAGGFHLRESSTGSFHPATADGNLLVGYYKKWRMESPGGGFHLRGAFHREFPSCDSRWKPPLGYCNIKCDSRWKPPSWMFDNEVRVSLL